MSEYRILGPLAYMAKEGCQDARCRRSSPSPEGRCIGYHCSYCDAPCSSQGHNCEVGTTLLAEARRIGDEEAL